MAAHSRRSVNGFVQPDKDSFEAIATLAVSSLSVRISKSSSAPRRSSSMLPSSSIHDGQRAETAQEPELAGRWSSEPKG